MTICYYFCTLQLKMMFYKIIALVYFVGVVLSSEVKYFDIERANDYFNDFLVEYQREYKSEEEKENRFQIFKHNLEKANQLNKQHDSANFGITKMMDLTEEEMYSQYFGLKEGNATLSPCNAGVISDKMKAWKSIDYRKTQKVTSVKDQEGCGSCWAFCTVAAIESQYAIKHSQLLDLSEQQLVDCSDSCNGCNGGMADRAMRDLINAGGIMSESAYKYTAKDNKCKFNKNLIDVSFSNCLDFQTYNEDKLQVAITHFGPLAVAMDADVFGVYKGGIINCTENKVNHGLLIVGYGVEKKTERLFWIVKNSWGVDWGEQGFLYIYASGNTCNMLSSPVVIPVIE